MRDGPALFAKLEGEAQAGPALRTPPPRRPSPATPPPARPRLPASPPCGRRPGAQRNPSVECPSPSRGKPGRRSALDSLFASGISPPSPDAPAGRRGVTSPSPLGQVPCQGASNGRGLLMRGIRENSVSLVRKALGEEPMLAVLPLAQRQEPVLTVAIRQACSPTIFALLLEADFDVNATCPMGLTALDVVAGMEPATGAAAGGWQGGSGFDNSDFAGIPCGSRGFGVDLQQNPVEVIAQNGFVRLGGSCRLYAPHVMTEDLRTQYAHWLLSFGAKHRQRAAQAAERAGLKRLVALVSHWGGAEVRSLRRIHLTGGCACGRAGDRHTSAERGSCIVCLPAEVSARLRDFLAPAPVASSWAPTALRPSLP